MSARAAPQSVLIFVVLVPRMHSSKYGIQFVHVCNLISNNLSSYSHLASKNESSYASTDIQTYLCTHSILIFRTERSFNGGWDGTPAADTRTDGQTFNQADRQSAS